MWTNRVYVFLYNCEVAKKGITLTTACKWLSAFHAISFSPSYAWCTHDARKLCVPVCVNMSLLLVCAWYAFSLSVYFFRHIIHTPVFSFRFLRGGKNVYVSALFKNNIRVCIFLYIGAPNIRITFRNSAAKKTLPE